MLAGIAGAAPAAGQVGPPATGAADKNPKLDSAFVALSARDGAAARSFAKQRGLDVEADAARVSVLAHDVAGARAALRSAGATAVRSAGGRVLEARVPTDALRSLAASSAVKYVAQVPYVEAQATNGEGPAATGADAWHAAGVDGTGVKVAIVDLGFTGLAASKARGDIPNTAIEHNECAAGLNGNTDHGTAVAEIVHEMAPGAQLYLACIDGTAALNAAKNFLVDAGRVDRQLLRRLLQLGARRRQRRRRHARRDRRGRGERGHPVGQLRGQRGADALPGRRSSTPTPTSSTSSRRATRATAW